MKPPPKVFGYVRVSTAEQAIAGLSLETQQQQITGYCMIKGWSVAEFFVEAGVSGSVPLADRPEGQRLLTTLPPGDTVITAQLDRGCSTAGSGLSVSMWSARGQIFGWCRTPMSKPRWRVAGHCATKERLIAPSLMLGYRSLGCRSSTRSLSSACWRVLPMRSMRMWR